MPAHDERQLISQAQEGNVQAFRALIERYMKQAYNIAYSVVNDHEEAQDITQESFVRIHRSLHRFRGEAQFGTWMYRIVMNQALNMVQRKKTKARVEVALTDHMNAISSSYEHTDEHPEMQMHVERALHNLPTLQRVVVILRHLNGLSTRQVSTILQCSEGTVKTHLHRGLKKMRVMLNSL